MTLFIPVNASWFTVNCALIDKRNKQQDRLKEDFLLMVLHVLQVYVVCKYGL